MPSNRRTLQRGRRLASPLIVTPELLARYRHGLALRPDGHKAVEDELQTRLGLWKMGWTVYRRPSLICCDGTPDWKPIRCTCRTALACAAALEAADRTQP